MTDISPSHDQSAHPSQQHIAIWRSEMRMRTDEELHRTISVHEWMVELSEAERNDYRTCVTLNSLANARAQITAARAELAWRNSKGISFPGTSYGYPRAFLDDLKARVSIESEIARVVTLRRRGKSLVGLCPFHDDRKPSLSVMPMEGYFHCFGCQEAGDVFDWLRRVDGLSFDEAVHYLCAIAGVDIPPKRRQTPTKGVVRFVD